MADEPTTPTTPAQDPAAPTTPTTPVTPAKTPEAVPYDRFKEVNEGYQALKAKLDKIESDQKKASETKLKEEGKLQELLAERERELAATRSEALRLKVASAKGLPAELVDRLRGDDEAALAKDADALLALLKKAPTAPGVPPGGGGAPPKVDLSQMTPEQIRKGLAEGKIKL